MEEVEDSYGIGQTWDPWVYSDTGTISASNLHISVERQAMATEIMKGMVSSGLMESPQDMAKEAVKIADALLAELRK